ncbi:potassium channel AKT2, partial [Haematococcus lacustris]
MLLMAHAGSITMLIIKGDKRMERFRDKRTQLSSFAKKMAVPQVLTASMQEHLEMEHKSDQAPDEQVLSIYPSCLRRAVMRHIYGNALRMCYLF